MNRRFIISAIITIAALSIGYPRYAETKQPLQLRISTASKHVLGIPSSFTFEIFNPTKRSISILNNLDGADGYLEVSISKDGSDFQNYQGVRWGKGGDRKSGIIALAPGRNIHHSEPIFWNNKPVISNMIAKDVAERSILGKINSYYAFPEPGTYAVKASYRLHLSDGRDSIVVESNGISFNIAEPGEDDLKIWNSIKDNGDIAYFLQEGDIPVSGRKPEDRKKVILEIEAILNEYPDSIYAEPLRQSMAKFQANEAKRQEAMKKMARPVQ